MRIIAFVILAAIALGFSILTINKGDRDLEPVAMMFWFLFIFCEIHWFRPRV